MKNTFKILLFLVLICGVIGVEEDRLKSVSVMEGDSVTLKIDSSKIQEIILVQWRFGASGAVIAETVKNEVSYPYHTETFKGRLQVDHQTGSLTIKNMRSKHSGLYKLQINHSAGSMTFNVTVYDSPPIIDFEMKSVMEGDSLTLHTDVTEPHGDELIVWRFGDDGKLIAKYDIETKSSKFYDDTDERFRDRLQLNDHTGSLTITNTRTTDSGLYTVKISSSSKETLYKRFNVTASESGLSSGGIARIAVAVLLVVAAAAAVVFYHLHKIFKQKKQLSVRVNEGDDATPKTDAEIQNDDRIMWVSGPQDTPIAERPETRETFDDSADGRIRDGLDEATGPLTITNITDSENDKLWNDSDNGFSYKSLPAIVTGNKVNGPKPAEMPLLSKKDVDE